MDLERGRASLAPFLTASERQLKLKSHGLGDISLWATTLPLRTSHLPNPPDKVV